MPEVHSVLTVASRGSKLSLDLYNFASVVPSATGNASDLAKTVVDLSRSLWHVGASQKEDARITTRAARETLVDIVQQCETAFADIEAVVPLEMINDGKSLTFGAKWEWNTVARAKIQYLLGHIKSLRLTLDVMAQAIRCVKVIEWSESQLPNPMSQAAVTMERMQLESLVVEQQLAHLRAGELFENVKLRHAESELELIPQDETSQAMTLFEDHASNPGRLMVYQAPSLSKIDTRNETEQLALVRRVSPNYIEDLLERWTKLQEIRRMQQPSIDSDDSSEDESLTPSVTHSNGLHSPIGPVLTQIDEPFESSLPAHRDVASPGQMPERTRRAYGPGSSTSPRMGQFPQANSWNARPASYFPAPAVKPPGSTRTSPRVSFSSQGAPVPKIYPPAKPGNTFPPVSRTPGPPMSSPIAVPTSGQVQPLTKPGILWRLRLGDKYWDFDNEKPIRSNTQLDPSQVQEDRYVSTEILAKFVTQEAIEDLKYRYDRVQVDMGDGRRTKLETLFCLRQALTFKEVEALVLRTQQRYEQRYKKPRPAPQLDRSISAPLPGPASYLRAPPDPHRTSSRGSATRSRDGGSRQRSPRPATFNDSDTDSDYTEKKRSRRGSNGSARSGTSKSSIASKSSKTAGHMRNVAAGAGFAALLEGVVEGLGAI